MNRSVNRSTTPQSSSRHGSAHEANRHRQQRYDGGDGSRGGGRQLESSARRDDPPSSRRENSRGAGAGTRRGGEGGFVDDGGRRASNSGGRVRPQSASAAAYGGSTRSAATGASNRSQHPRTLVRSATDDKPLTSQNRPPRPGRSRRDDRRPASAAPGGLRSSGRASPLSKGGGVGGGDEWMSTPRGLGLCPWCGLRRAGGASEVHAPSGCLGTATRD